MAGRAAQDDAKHDIIAHFHRFDADVISVFHRTDQTAAIVSDVEFARQIIEGTVVDDDLGHLLHIRIHVNQFDRVDAGGGVHRQVADIVRAAAPCVQPHALHPAQHLRAVLGLDQPHLEVGARRDLDVAAGERLGGAREFAELEGREQAARNPQPRHEGILDRAEKEQAVPLEPKGVLLVRRLVADGVFD